MEFFVEACRQRNSLVSGTLSSGADGHVSGTVDYDIFGEPVTETGVFAGSAGGSGGISALVFAYAGKPYDPVTGLSDYGFRDYAPTLAHFTTVDPIRDGFNWYAYCNSDPVNYVDAWGLDPWQLFGTCEEARIDFGTLYNDDSINDGIEYGTTIYRTNKGGKDAYYYSTPNQGKEDEVWLLTNPLDQNDELEEFTHTHGDTSGDPEHLSRPKPGKQDSDIYTSEKYRIRISAFGPSSNCYIFDPNTANPTEIVKKYQGIPGITYDNNGNIVKPNHIQNNSTPIGTDPNNGQIPQYLLDRLKARGINPNTSPVGPKETSVANGNQSSSNCNNN